MRKLVTILIKVLKTRVCSEKETSHQRKMIMKPILKKKKQRIKTSYFVLKVRKFTDQFGKNK